MKARKWYDGLGVQIVLLMTLALLPLGAIAIYQTNRVEAQANRDAELGLLALTAQAARTEEVVLERAAGVVELVASSAAAYLADPERCKDELGKFTEANSIYSFIGFVPKTGIAACNSTGEVRDFSDRPAFDDHFKAQERTLVVDETTSKTGGSAFILSEPYYIEGQFAGFVSLAIPYDAMPDAGPVLQEEGLLALFTFNAQGVILTGDEATLPEVFELPQTRTLSSLKTTRSKVFSGVNANGDQRIYTVVPIEGSPATVLGVWRSDDRVATVVSSFVKPALFPVLMWFASMAVALASLHTLVLRHLSRIRQNMDSFSKNRRTDKDNVEVTMPYELRALKANFDQMADDILREEARLEDTLREKNVLIKEVHHRVKNNLQLIASIMNMHIRSAQEAETKTVLSRVQDRVLSLATIHRNLYQSHDGGRVNAGDLVKEIVQKSVEMGFSSHSGEDVAMQIDPVLLYPDQAVPLSLLVAEAMTNAVKYLGEPVAGEPAVDVSLKQDGQTCTLMISNTVVATSSSESTGLGAQLMNAFALQLGAQITAQDSDGRYSFRVVFKAADFEPEARDF